MKKILMAAVAVSALSAGAANAVNISAATVSNVALTPPTISTGASGTAYTIANSTILVDAVGAATANATTGATTDISALIGGTTSAGVFDPGAGGTNYSATLTLTNATFSSAVTNSSITLLNAGASCVPGSVNVVSGGAVGTSSVTAVFNIPNTCSSSTSAYLAPNGVKFVAPFTVATAASVTGTVGFKVVATDTAFNASGLTGGAITLVRAATPYTVAVTADTVTTSLSLASSTRAAYTFLKTSSADATLGTLTSAVATAPTSAAGSVVYADLNGGALPAITYDATVTATAGNFAVIKPYLAQGTATAAAMTLATTSASSGTTLAASGTGTVTAVISGTNTTAVNSAQTYTATVTPILVSNTKVTTPAAVTGALQTITLEGVSFSAPWVGGSLSSSQSYIRVSNSGSATGQVTVSLLNPTGAASATQAGSVCTSTTLSKLSAIAASGELVISPADLTTCFGAFTRGDVSVTIQSTSTSLTAKARNVTASTVSELSLGAGTFN